MHSAEKWCHLQEERSQEDKKMPNERGHITRGDRRWWTNTACCNSVCVGIKSSASYQVWSGQRIQRFSQDSTKATESQSDQECHWDDNDPASKGHSWLGNLYNISPWWLNRSVVTNPYINQSLCAMIQFLFSVFVNEIKNGLKLLSTWFSVVYFHKK